MEELRTFAVMSKPVGSSCNLKCAYCYYLDKALVNKQPNNIMSNEVLEAYIRQNIEAHGKLSTVEFAWHGGEPTLAPLSFYKKAIELQRVYGEGRNITNTMQTNATLLDEKWCELFVKNGFQLGVSIDGPKELHETYRGDSFDRTMNGIALLKKHNVNFNTLTTVNAANWKQAKKVYRFLREITDFMQFLPVVETCPAAFEAESKQRFATPPGINSAQIKHPVLDFSVPSDGYGIFLSDILNEWRKNDFGRKHIQIFEATIGNMLKKPGGLCVHEALCGHCAVVEADGNVYSCDRYAYPNYRLGNILQTPLKQLLESNRSFGMNKTYGLPNECFDCEYIKLCFGGCPKDRILWTDRGQGGKNYLCESYRIIFKALKECFATKINL